MYQIWKYDIRPGMNEIKMPANTKLLCIQVQNGCPRLWAQVVNAPLAVIRKVAVRGTGFEFADMGQYVGTFQVSDGMFVWHVFDLGEIPA
jgi:hypothetical protein